MKKSIKTKEHRKVFVGLSPMAALLQALVWFEGQEKHIRNGLIDLSMKKLQNEAYAVTVTYHMRQTVIAIALRRHLK